VGWQDERVTSAPLQNIHDALADLKGYWSPVTVAVVNDYEARVVKVHGEFTRHSHPETDEFFLVLSGSLTIRLDDENVVLNEGDAYVVRRGQSHQPYAASEATLLLFEPSATVNTGDTPSELTAERREA
jgi:mannose-6-phosphate isomerase-like protein (cupin superfamily)